MIIYLEGPDGSGKSTLYENLQKSLTKAGFNVFFNHGLNTHPKDENRTTEKELYKTMKTMCKYDTVCIVDRGPISDLVYRVFDNYNSVTTLPKLLKFMKDYEKNIMTIYCRTDLAETAMNIRGDENPIAVQNHKEITKVFDLVMSQFASELKHNFIKYDFSKNKAINEIINKCNYFVYLKAGE